MAFGALVKSAPPRRPRKPTQSNSGELRSRAYSSPELLLFRRDRSSSFAIDEPLFFGGYRVRFSLFLILVFRFGFW